MYRFSSMPPTYRLLNFPGSSEWGKNQQASTIWRAETRKENETDTHLNYGPKWFENSSCNLFANTLARTQTHTQSSQPPEFFTIRKILGLLPLPNPNPMNEFFSASPLKKRRNICQHFSMHSETLGTALWWQAVFGVVERQLDKSWVHTQTWLQFHGIVRLRSRTNECKKKMTKLERVRLLFIIILKLKFPTRKKGPLRQCTCAFGVLTAHPSLQRTCRARSEMCT